MREHSEEGYELFRRAILTRDADAWAAIHTCYRSLLISWAARCGASSRLTECYDDIADQALSRAWMALTPDRFANFTSLARLLSYLRTCVNSTVVDNLRAQMPNECVLQDSYADQAATPEQIILADLTRDALWRMMLANTMSRAERIVLVESFIHCFPPRTIHASHPQLFPNVEAVYIIKRNLFDRLQRNRDVLQLGKELLAG